MAFKFVLFAALLAIGQAGLIAGPTHTLAIANPAVDAVAATHQNVVRSFGGTVSQYSKSVETPYSSVRKEDTRINNNVYTPAIAKTLSYAAPTAAVYTHSAPAATVQYHQQQLQHEVAPTVHYQQHEVAPTVHYQQHHEVAPTPIYTHAAPSAVVKSVATPIYQHAAPAAVVKNVATPIYEHAAPVYHHQQPAVATTTYNHGPAASTYSHNAPGVAAYGTSQTVHYSPAETVSHMSFDGFGTHWGF